MLHTLVTHAIAAFVGAGAGAYAWNRYRNKIAADLAKVKGVV